MNNKRKIFLIILLVLIVVLSVFYITVYGFDTNQTVLYNKQGEILYVDNPDEASLFDLHEIIGNISNLGWGKYIGIILFNQILNFFIF